MKKYNFFSNFIKDFRKYDLNIEFSPEGKYIRFYILNNRIPILVKKIRIFDSSYPEVYEIAISAEIDLEKYNNNLTLSELKRIIPFIEAIENNKDIFYSLIDNL